MEFRWLDSTAGHFGGIHFDSFWIGLAIKFCANTQTRLGGGVANQVDNYLIVDKGTSSPVLSNMAKHPISTISQNCSSYLCAMPKLNITANHKSRQSASPSPAGAKILHGVYFRDMLNY